MDYLVFDIGGTSVKYALSDQLGKSEPYRFLSNTGYKCKDPAAGHG